MNAVRIPSPDAIFLATILLIYASWSPLHADTPAAARPNILFLLTDDQRWDTLGCMGNEAMRTPAIDRLAAEGVLFPNAFVTTSVCSVSRTSIITGQFARRRTDEPNRPIPTLQEANVESIIVPKSPKHGEAR